MDVYLIYIIHNSRYNTYILYKKIKGTTVTSGNGIRLLRDVGIYVQCIYYMSV